jgi:hypothetical protein
VSCAAAFVAGDALTKGVGLKDITPETRKAAW